MDAQIEKNNEPERLDLRSPDPAVARAEELARLFPEARTEGGKIDFDQLKRALGETVDPGRERYGLVWPGKAECFKTIQAPSVATLRPTAEESLNFDTTENLIIEGDNLEVIKLLQKSYLSQVKVIYIDPPYNTGSDFIYPDDYAETLQTYLQYSGQVDTEGRRFGTNTEADGRFHSKWLNMMYPRLYLARNLLRDDGVIFVSIDDHEVKNLTSVMNEVFGEENHYATIVWQKKDTPSNDAKTMSVTHEYVLIYQKSEEFDRNLLPRSEDQLDNYKNPDNDPRGPWIRTSLIRKEVRPDRVFKLKTPKGTERTPPPGTSWRLPPKAFTELARDNLLWWGHDENGELPFRKRFLSEVQPGVVPVTWWDYKFAGSNRNAKTEIRELFDGDVPFETPKPTSLIRQILKIAMLKEGIVLDFFAGSGTTAQAVLQLNAEDGGRRRFILVQLPEPTGRTDYPTIPDIAKSRVLRFIEKRRQSGEGKLEFKDAIEREGFRVFKLAESNLKTWDAAKPSSADELQQQLEMHVDHLREGRTSSDFLYEILLKSGFPLTANVEKLALGGIEIFSVAAGALLICLERKLTLEAIRAMTEGKPERVVCLDEGFAGNDQLKTNAVQTFKAKGIVFRTV